MTQPDHINLDSLHPGMIVKNYSELCTLLGVKPDTNIKRQLNSLSKYVIAEKNEGSRKYVIKEVLSQKEYKLEVRSNSKYVQQIQNILLGRLINISDNRLVCTHKQLMDIFSGVNELFYEENKVISAAFKQYSDNGIKDLNITAKQIRGFKETVEASIYFRIRRGLENIQSRKIIDITESFMVYNHLADTEEYKLLHNIELYLFNKYKCNSWGEIFLYKKNVDAFMKDWGNKTRQIGKNAYKVKVITLNPKVLEDIKSVVFNTEEDRKELNDIFMNIVHDKILELRFKDDDPDRYLQVGKILIECLMSIDSDMSKELKKRIN